MATGYGFRKFDGLMVEIDDEQKKKARRTVANYALENNLSHDDTKTILTQLGLMDKD